MSGWRKWTPEQDRLLLQMHTQHVRYEEMAAVIGDGCRPHHIITRLYRIKNGASLSAGCRMESKSDEWTRNDVVTMDDEFAHAMRTAISKNLEQPIVGVVKTPSTKRARYVPASTFMPSKSVAADVAALGAVGGAFF